MPTEVKQKPRFNYFLQFREQHKYTARDK